MTRSGRRKYFGYYFPAYYLITVFVVCLWGLKYFSVIALPIIIIIPCLFFRQRIPKLDLVDFIVLALFLYEILSFSFLTVNQSASFSYLKQFCFSVLVYFLVRFFFDKERKIRLFLSSVSYYFIFLSLLGVLSFFIFLHALKSLELTNAVNFKNLFRPLGVLSNDWSTLMLCFAGVIILTSKYLKGRKRQVFIIMGLFPVVFGIITSFSRGMYISLSVAAIIATVLLFSQKIHFLQKVFIFTSAVFVIVIIILPFFEEVLTTAALTKTVSQVRSIETRMNLIKTGYDIFVKYPFWGIGSGNFSLVASYIFENDHVMFTSRVTNSFIQLICEKGIPGILLWLVFGVLTICHFFSQKEKSLKSIIIIIFLLTFSIRELTFSSFFEHPYIQLVVFTVIALFINITKPPAVRSKNFTLLLLVFLIGSYAFLAAKSILKYHAEKYNKEVFTVTDPHEMLNRIQKARQLCPDETGYKINESLIDWKLFVLTKNHMYLNRARNLLNELITPDSLDSHLIHNLAWINYYDGDTLSSFNAFRYLTNRFPEVSLYNESFGQALWKKEDHDKAINYFQKAIVCSPNLLDSPFWTDLIKDDSLSTSVIINKILKSIDFTRLHDPILLAKYGKILLHSGKINEARQCLEQSAKSLPNLNRTWLNLALIAISEKDTSDFELYMKRSMLLDGNDYLPPHYLAEYYHRSGDGKNYDIHIGKAHKNYQNLCSKYYFKSLNWYDCESFKNDIIPDSPAPLPLNLQSVVFLRE